MTARRPQSRASRRPAPSKGSSKERTKRRPTPVPRRSVRASTGPGRTAPPSLLKRLDALEAAVGEVRAGQDAQFLQLMKFVVLRHLSLLALIAEGRVPERIAAQVRDGVDEGARRIADAATLADVKETDMRLQQHLRQIVLAFRQP